MQPSLKVVAVAVCIILAGRLVPFTDCGSSRTLTRNEAAVNYSQDHRPNNRPEPRTTAYEEAVLFPDGVLEANGVRINPPTSNHTATWLLYSPLLIEEAKPTNRISLKGTGIIVCEWWTVPYSVFVTHCLARLFAARELLLARRGDFVILPYESFVEQWALEVLGLSEDQIEWLPTGVVWQFPENLNTYNVKFERALVVESDEYGLHDVNLALRGMAPCSNSNDKPLILMLERLEITQPENFDSIIDGFVSGLSGVEVACVRMEAISVVQQLKLLARASVLISTVGGGTLNSHFLCPGAHSIELVPMATANWTVYDLFPSLGNKVRVAPLNATEPKKQPVYDADALVALVRKWIPGNLGVASKKSVLTKPLVGCNNVFHQKKENTYMGWYKLTYLIKNGWALKTPRNLLGWKRVFKEMRILSNTSEAAGRFKFISPVEAICFPGVPSFGLETTPMFIQEQFNSSLDVLEGTHRLGELCLAALTGFSLLWKDMMESESNVLDLYCDPAVKNWAAKMVPSKCRGPSRNITRPVAEKPRRRVVEHAPIQIWYPMALSAYDLDSVNIVRNRSLCVRDKDCTCPGSPNKRRACVNSRCQLTGVKASFEHYIQDWIGTAINMVCPVSIADNPTIRNITTRVRAKKETQQSYSAAVVQAIHELKEWRALFGGVCPSLCDVYKLDCQ